MRLIISAHVHLVHDSCMSRRKAAVFPKRTADNGRNERRESAINLLQRCACNAKLARSILPPPPPHPPRRRNEGASVEAERPKQHLCERKIPFEIRLIGEIRLIRLILADAKRHR